ncbi:MAG: ATP-binding cassette domain-containing protein, partial [Pseudomonadota bacterium]
MWYAPAPSKLCGKTVPTMASYQYIYFMQGLTKAYGSKKILEDVHLQFYPDAKIGIVGVNGAGKSTLL